MGVRGLVILEVGTRKVTAASEWEHVELLRYLSGNT